MTIQAKIRSSARPWSARAALLASAAAGFALLDAGSAAAQATQIEEVVVTARQRNETLLDVPVAVSAITGSQLARAQSVDLTSIASHIPTMIVARGSSGNGGVIVLRGISSSSTDPGLEASVAVNADGVMISRGYITQAAFFDLAQVEVLKGPQALFFGKNSPAGVISLRSAGPTNQFAASAKVGYEFNAHERYAEAAVGGPITDTFGARFALRYSKMDGWLTNDAKPLANPIEPQYPLPGAVGNEVTPAGKTWVGRLTLNWAPTDKFTANLKILGNHYTDNDLTGYSQLMHCGNGVHSTTLGFQDPYSDCTADGHRSSGGLPAAIAAGYPVLRDNGGKAFTKSWQWLTALRLDYDAGPLKLTSVTGYYDVDTDGFGAYDYSVYQRFPGINGERDRIYTQEFRGVTALDGPLNFAGGVYFERYKRESYTVGRGVGSIVPTGQVYPDPSGITALYYPDDFVRSRTFSAFAQAIWKITPDIELAGGARYTKEKKNADLTNVYINTTVPPGAATSPGAAYLPVGTHLRGPFNDDNWSPEVTLTYHPVAGQSVYAAYRTGYKSGGFSTTAVLLRTNTLPQLTFQSETSKGFEAGYKAQLFDGRLSVTTDIYRYKFGNLQRSSLDIATTSFVVRNAATAITKGAELESSFQATPELTLNAAVAYNKATYSRFPNAACYNGQTAATGCLPIAGTTASGQDLSGTPVSRAPKWVITAGFDWAHPVTDEWSFGISADAKYSGSYRTQDDGDPRAVMGAYTKLNASLRVFQPKGHWEFDLVGRDLTNEWIVLSGSAKPGGRPGDITGTTERPREVHIVANYRY